MLKIEEADDLDFTNIADAKSKFIEELSAEQLKLLENDKEYQELDTEDKIQKLKDTIILNRKRKDIEEQFASQVAQFENTNILNKYADLENYTLSELSKTVSTKGLESGEAAQIEKLQNSYREKIKERVEEKIKPVQENTKIKREKKGLTWKEGKEKEELEKKMDSLNELILKLEESFSDIQANSLGSLQERSKKYEEAKAELEKSEERYLELLEKEEG